MVKSERWGKKYKDTRDWKSYSEELVVRGEFLLELDWVKSWDKEVEQMNQGKRGAPYIFPESLIELQAVWNQWVDFRGVEGITRKLQEYDLIPEYNDFSTINRRVNKIEAEVTLPQEGTIFVSCDGSGMKMTNRGDYKETKYGKKKKKFVKVTISADPIKKKLLAVDVSIDGEGPSEPEVAISHLEELINIVAPQYHCRYTDSAFFRFLNMNLGTRTGHLRWEFPELQASLASVRQTHYPYW